MTDQPVTEKRRTLPVVGMRAKPNEMPLGTRIAILGDAKTGKSTLAATARNPITLDFEKGRLQAVDVMRMSPLYRDPGINPEDYPSPFNRILDEIAKPRKFEFIIAWLEAAFKELVMSGEFQTVIIDTVDSLLDVCLQAYWDDHGVSKDQRLDYKAVYSKLLPILRKFIGKLPADTIWVCHVQSFLDGGERVVVPAIPDKIREEIIYHSDIVGMIYTPDKKGSENRFYVRNRSNWPTGCGFSFVPEDLPTTMEALYACWRDGDDPESYQPDLTGLAKSKGVRK